MQTDYNVLQLLYLSDKFIFIIMKLYKMTKVRFIFSHFLFAKGTACAPTPQKLEMIVQMTIQHNVHMLLHYIILRPAEPCVF